MKPWVLILILITVLILIIIASTTLTRVFMSTELYESLTTLMLVSQATSGPNDSPTGDVDTIDCDGLNLAVPYKEGQLKPGSGFMRQCILSLVNCDAEDVSLSGTSISWTLGNYYNQGGNLGSDVLHPNDVKLVSCSEAFSGVDVDINTDEFVIDKIPAKVTLTSSTGTVWDEWEVTYISDKGLI